MKIKVEIKRTVYVDLDVSTVLFSPDTLSGVSGTFYDNNGREEKSISLNKEELQFAIKTCKELHNMELKKLNIIDNLNPNDSIYLMDYDSKFDGFKYVDICTKSKYYFIEKSISESGDDVFKFHDSNGDLKRYRVSQLLHKLVE